MTSGGDRLAQAMKVFLAFRATDGASSDSHETQDELLERHSDLRDLLEPMLDDSPEEAATGIEGRVLGDYRIVREIGRGGSGVVYEARQLSLDRRAAVKLLSAELGSNPARLARFKREAVTLGRLEHEGIVRVLEVDSAQGLHWFAMEFIEGESLDHRLERAREQGHGGESLRAMVVIAAEVAEALQHAHEAGIVHRDVKPSNVLLRADGRAVLGDFGLAREEGLPSVTVEGSIAGTPDYMAPEQIIAGTKTCDERSDVFSLGATLYEALTLRRPFHAPTVSATLDRIVRGEPRDPRSLNAAIPADLVAIVQKALEKDPARRYATARAMADDLRAFLELRPIAARPASTFERVRRWCRREPLRATVAALLLLGIPTIAALGGYLLASLPDIHAARDAREGARFETLLADGFVANMSGRPAAAFAAFEQAWSLRPGDPDALVALTLAHSKFRSHEEAWRFFVDHAGPRPDADLRRLEVFLLRQRKREDEARTLEQSLGPPRSPMALELTGAAIALLVGTGERDAAQRSLPYVSLAVRITPRPRALYFAQWAACAVAAHDAAAMHESAQALLALWPDRAFAWQLAATNLQFEDPEHALACQQRAIALGADDVIAWCNLAAYLYKCDRLDEAIAAARKSVARDAQEGRARNILVNLLQAAGDKAAQHEACAAWVAATPDSAAAHQQLGRFLVRSGDRQEGVQQLARAAELAPQDVSVLYDASVGYDAIAEDAAAEDALRRALVLEPADAKAHTALLETLEQTHDSAKLRAEHERWTDACPRDPKAFAALAIFLLALEHPTHDDTARALAAAQRADYLAEGKDPALLEEPLARSLTASGEFRAAELCRARATR